KNLLPTATPRSVSLCDFLFSLATPRRAELCTLPLHDALPILTVAKREQTCCGVSAADGWTPYRVNLVQLDQIHAIWRPAVGRRDAAAGLLALGHRQDRKSVV